MFPMDSDSKECTPALDRIRKDTAKKGWWVVDADIKGYFNNINHEKLMLMVKQRISIERFLK